jgi:hypothetical protein
MKSQYSSGNKYDAAGAFMPINPYLSREFVSFPRQQVTAGNSQDYTRDNYLHIRQDDDRSFRHLYVTKLQPTVNGNKSCGEVPSRMERYTAPDTS